MCLSILNEDVLYGRIKLDAVLDASLLDNLPASERLDGSLEKLVCLKSYDELVILVDISGSV